jgi:hypothetical protein
VLVLGGLPNLVAASTLAASPRQLPHRFLHPWKLNTPFEVVLQRNGIPGHPIEADGLAPPSIPSSIITALIFVGNCAFRMLQNEAQHRLPVFPRAFCWVEHDKGES